MDSGEVVCRAGNNETWLSLSAWLEVEEEEEDTLSVYGHEREYSVEYGEEYGDDHIETEEWKSREGDLASRKDENWDQDE